MPVKCTHTTHMKPCTERLLDEPAVAWAIKADRACPEVLGRLSDGEMRELVESGEMVVFATTLPGETLICCMRPDVGSLLIGPLYGEANPQSLPAMARAMSDHIDEYAKSAGIATLLAAVSLNHPLFQGLMSLYGRMGYSPDLVRVIKTLESEDE